MADGATRRAVAAIGALWALGLVFAACSGTSHGYVPRALQGTPAYEWHGVLLVSAAISVESLVLSWLLLKAPLRPVVRTIAALAVFGAAFAVGIADTVRGMPGWYYVNTFWTMLVVAVLAMRLLVQAAIALRARAKTPR